MIDFSTFVGVPWREHGRDRDGCDCWGLFRLVFEAGTGIALPSFAERYVTTADRAEIGAIVGGALEAWTLVPAAGERAYDGVLMAVRGGHHVGLVVRRGLMLHQPQGRASVIEPLDRHSRVLRGIYRHKDLIGGPVE